MSYGNLDKEQQRDLKIYLAEQERMEREKRIQQENQNTESYYSGGSGSHATSNDSGCLFFLLFIICAPYYLIMNQLYYYMPGLEHPIFSCVIFPIIYLGILWIIVQRIMGPKG